MALVSATYMLTSSHCALCCPPWTGLTTTCFVTDLYHSGDHHQCRDSKGVVSGSCQGCEWVGSPGGGGGMCVLSSPTDGAWREVRACPMFLPTPHPQWLFLLRYKQEKAFVASFCQSFGLSRTCLRALSFFHSFLIVSML